MADRVQALKPQLDAIRQRWKDDPEPLAQQTLALYRDRGVSLMDPAVLKGSLLQMPIFIAFFNAVRGVLATLEGVGFLWIRNLARPDFLLGLVVTAVMALAAILTPAVSEQAPGWARWLPVWITFGMLLFMSSGFGLYMLANAGVSVVQGGLLRKAEAVAGERNPSRIPSV